MAIRHQNIIVWDSFIRIHINLLVTGILWYASGRQPHTPTKGMGYKVSGHGYFPL
jgi:hypothetical protein